MGVPPPVLRAPRRRQRRRCRHLARKRPGDLLGCARAGIERGAEDRPRPGRRRHRLRRRGARCRGDRSPRGTAARPGRAPGCSRRRPGARRRRPPRARRDPNRGSDRKRPRRRRDDPSRLQRVLRARARSHQPLHGPPGADQLAGGGGDAAERPPRPLVVDRNCLRGRDGRDRPGALADQVGPRGRDACRGRGGPGVTLRRRRLPAARCALDE